MRKRNLLCNVYVRGSKLIVPTTAKTEAGYYLEVEPVEIAETDDLPAAVQAIVKAMTRGNPIVPAPLRVNFPKPVVLKPAGVKSWAAFVRGTRTWTIERVDTSYLVIPQRQDGQGWIQIREEMIVVREEGSIEWAAREILKSIL